MDTNRKPAPTHAAERGRRSRDPEATRARILAAAVQEFSRYGPGGARGDRIAQRAHSSERMVYYYFGNKDGLYRAALESVYAALRQAERSLRLDALEPAQALSAFCRFVWRYYQEHPEFIGMVNVENLQQARQLRRSGRLSELVSPMVQRLGELLRRGEAAGVFRAGVDPAELYVAIAGLGYFYLSSSFTLSAVLGRGLREPARLEAYWRSSEEMVRRHVCRIEALPAAGDEAGRRAAGPGAAPVRPARTG